MCIVKRMNALTTTTNAPAGGLLQRLLQPILSVETFDFWASRLNRTWRWQTPMARIEGREPASANAVTLLLKPNAHWAGHVAGQHLSLTAEVDGRRITRSYSPCDAPRPDRRIPLTVQRVDGGKLSTWLCEHARIGEVVELRPAFGAMTPAILPPAPLLLLAAGSGITPMMAIVRALAAQGMPQPVTLLYWTRTRAQRCFVQALRTIASAHAHFRVSFVLTGEAAQQADESTGRIGTGTLLDQVSGLAQRQVYACGGSGFVDQAHALLTHRVAGLQSESFTPALPRRDDAGTATVRLAVSGRTIHVARGVPLLAALEAQGVSPPYGCRMGICNTCRCEKLSGSTRDLLSGERHDASAAALKLCQHGAAGDLVLAL